MHTLALTTKRKADAMLVDSLFRPVNGGTLTRERYCTGKYSESIKLRTFDVPDNIKALWAEKRKDSHGNYWALMCLSGN